MAGRWGPRLPGEVGVVDGWEVGAATPWRSGGGGWLRGGGRDSLEKCGWWMAGRWGPRFPGEVRDGGWLGGEGCDSLEKCGWWMARTWEPRLPGEGGVVDGWDVGAQTPWRYLKQLIKRHTSSQWEARDFLFFVLFFFNVFF